MNDDVLDLLTPGAVCLKREEPRKGAPVHVLMLTNVSLSAKLQEKYPVQVVYTNEKRQVFSRTAASFFELYEFHNVDIDVETRIGDIFTPLSEDEDEEEPTRGQIEIPRTGLPVATTGAPRIAKDEPVTAGLVALSDDDEDDDSELLPEHEKLAADGDKDDDHNADATLSEDDSDIDDEDYVPDNSGATGIEFLMTTLDAPLPVLNHDELSAALVGYSQEPDSSRSIVTHRLAFALGGEISIKSLVEAFRPNSDRNTVDVFALNGPHFTEMIQWSYFVGVFPEIAGGEAYANVILIEESEVKTAEEAFLEEVETHLQAQEARGIEVSAGNEGPSLVEEVIAQVVAAAAEPVASDNMTSDYTEMPVSAEIIPVLEENQVPEIVPAEAPAEIPSVGVSTAVLDVPQAVPGERPVITLKKAPNFGVQNMVQNIRVNQPTIRNS